MSSLVLPSSPQAIDQALVILSRGGVVAHATETCYGLACDLTNPKAVERLFAIKERTKDQPVSALFPSVTEAKKYVVWDEEAEKLAQKFLPGPLTLILLLRTDTPHRLFVTFPKSEVRPVRHSFSEGGSPKSSIGIRVSSHPLALELAQRFGKPLSTTSANLHSKPNPYSAADITAQFQDHKGPDLLIDSGVLPVLPPSTVIDLTGPHGPHTRRQGRIRE